MRGRSARPSAVIEAAKLRSHGTGIVMFAPLPPLENGIADYSAELLQPMSRLVPTVVVIDDFAPAPPPALGLEAIRLSEYLGRDAEFARWPHVYQMGNNADHVYMLPMALRRPGIVVLHDVSLHHLVDQATLRWGDELAYSALLEIEHGDAGRVLAEQFRQRRWRGRTVFYELPMTRELLGRAQAVMVHSLYAATRAAAQAPATPVVHLHHHVAPSAVAARDSLGRVEARQALGLPPESLLLVSLGFVTRAKQIDTVLRFLARHRAEWPALRYVLVGQDQPEHFDVRSLAASLGLQDIVHVTGYADEDAFYRWIAAADVVVNLRYPSGGETSGTLIRALALGACVVVNDIGPFAEYPHDICVRVPIDDLARHDQAFTAALLPLLRQPDLRQRIGKAAALHMAATHRLSDSVAAYLRTASRHGGPPARHAATTCIARPARPAHEAKLAALVASGALRRGPLPLWASEPVLPRLSAPGGIPLPSAAPVLAIGLHDDETDLLRQLCDVDHARLDRVQSALERPPRRGQYAVAVADCTADQIDEVLSAIGASLRHEGVGVVVVARTAARDPADAPRDDAEAQTRSADSAILRQAVERARLRCERLAVGREHLSAALDAAPEAAPHATSDATTPDTVVDDPGVAPWLLVVSRSGQPGRSVVRRRSGLVGQSS